MESKPSSLLSIEDIDEQRKITLVKWIVVVAISVLLPLGILSINNNNIAVGVLDFSFAGILAVLLFFITKKKILYPNIPARNFYCRSIFLLPFYEQKR